MSTRVEAGRVGSHGSIADRIADAPRVIGEAAGSTSVAAPTRRSRPTRDLDHPPGSGDPPPMNASHEGGCTCRQVRYRMTRAPMIVHACHCRWCQRESGTAFALNALVEGDQVELLTGAPELVDTPSLSGRGQRIARCPTCKVAVWSNYGGAGDKVRFIRVGTLDDPDAMPPDVHIFTASKQPWVVLPADARAVAEYYDSKEVWSAESLARRRALFG